MNKESSNTLEYESSNESNNESSNESNNESGNQFILNEELLEDNSSEDKLLEDKLIDDKLLEETQKNKEDKVCGYKQFKDKLDKLSEESSESVYSYVSIDEPKSEKFSYFYIICFVIGLFLIYLLYNGNIFITLIEFVLNFSFPYIYIPIKLYINKKEILYKIKNN